MKNAIARNIEHKGLLCNKNTCLNTLQQAVNNNKNTAFFSKNPTQIFSNPEQRSESEIVLENKKGNSEEKNFTEHNFSEENQFTVSEIVFTPKKMRKKPSSGNNFSKSGGGNNSEEKNKTELERNLENLKIANNNSKILDDKTTPTSNSIVFGRKKINWKERLKKLNIINNNKKIEALFDSQFEDEILDKKENFLENENIERKGLSNFEITQNHHRKEILNYQKSLANNNNTLYILDMKEIGFEFANSKIQESFLNTNFEKMIKIVLEQFQNKLVVEQGFLNFEEMILETICNMDEEIPQISDVFHSEHRVEDDFIKLISFGPTKKVISKYKGKIGEKDFTFDCSIEGLFPVKNHTRILIENGEYTFESESIARNNTGFESNTKIKFSTENKELFFSLPIFMKEIKWNPKIPFELSIYQTSSNDGKEFFKNSLYCRHNNEQGIIKSNNIVAVKNVPLEEVNILIDSDTKLLRIDGNCVFDHDDVRGLRDILKTHKIKYISLSCDASQNNELFGLLSDIPNIKVIDLKNKIGNKDSIIHKAFIKTGSLVNLRRFC